MILITMLLPLLVSAEERQPTVEVRAYLLDRQHRPLPLAGIGAFLVLEGLSPGGNRIPMTPRFPRGLESLDALDPMEFRDVEQTPLVAGLCILIQGLEPNVGRRDAGAVPYFTASLSPEQSAALPCTASLIFLIDGEGRQARGFNAGPPDAQLPSSVCGRLSDDLRSLERRLRENDRDGAADAFRRVSAAVVRLQERRRFEPILDTLDASLAAGRRAEALDVLKSLRAACEDCGDPVVSERR